MFEFTPPSATSLQTRTYTVSTSGPLGRLLLLKVEKDPLFLLPEDEWYCSKIVVTPPGGYDILFPCHRWISRGEIVELRGGNGVTQIYMIMFFATSQFLINHLI